MRFANIYRRDNYRDSGKLTTYFDIKDNFKMEEYLNIKKIQYRQFFGKFRISAHNLRIETGRYEQERNDSGQYIKLDRSRRLSVVSGSVEDEFHFLFKCPFYNKERETVLNEIYKDNQNFLNLFDKQNFLWILKKENSSILFKLCNFLVIGFGMIRSRKILDNRRSS